MYHIIYAAQAPKTLFLHQLEEYRVKTLATANRKGLTGLLVYNDGYFLGLLEGDTKQVKSRWQHLQKDETLLEPIRIHEGIRTSRYFKDWTVIYKSEDLNYSFNTVSGINHRGSDPFIIQVLLNLHLHYTKLHPDRKQFNEELHSNFELRLYLLMNREKGVLDRKAS